VRNIGCVARLALLLWCIPLLLLWALPYETHGQANMTRADDSPPAVQVTTDRRHYRRGESILVTISNALTTVLYAPLGQESCSITRVERLVAGQWEPQGACTPGGLTFFLAVPPGSTMRGVWRPGGPDFSLQGPLVSEPSVPGVSTPDVRTLPPAKPWQPGDPVREVPRGERPFPGQPPAVGTLAHALGAGTYRIAVHFLVGSTSGSAHTAYSEAFVVID